MDGQIMDRPLQLEQLRWPTGRTFGDGRVFSRAGDGEASCCTDSEHGLRVRRLAQARAVPSAQPGDGVGTPAWNSHRRVEADVGVPGTSAVLHTLGLCVHRSIGAREGAVVLAIGPTFRTTSRGTPFRAALRGATPALAGRPPAGPRRRVAHPRFRQAVPSCRCRSDHRHRPLDLVTTPPRRPVPVVPAVRRVLPAASSVS